MITMISGERSNEYRGLSTDEKPVKRVPNGSLFYEFDTTTLYVFDSDAGEWIEQFHINDGGGGGSSGGGGSESSTAILKATNVMVHAADWEEDPEEISTSFPYRASVALAGVTGDMFSSVVFDIDEACSGNYAPVVQSSNGVVYIYAAEVPENDITILTVVAW